MTPTNSESTSEIRKDSAKPSRGHVHQRVFLKSGTIIQRPPVLFRIPDLQNASAPKALRAQDPIEGPLPETPSHFRVDETPTQSQIVAAPHQIFSSPTPEDASSTWAAPKRERNTHDSETRDSETRETRSGESMAAKASESTLRIDVPREESGLRNSAKASEKLEAGTADERAPSPGSFKFALPPEPPRSPNTDSLRTGQATNTSSEKNTAGQPVSDRSISTLSEGNRSTYALPPLDPVPAGRNWMEMLGSRVMIFLVMGAIAAVAYMANQSGNFPSEATIADLEDEAASQDRLSRNSNAKMTSEDSRNSEPTQSSPAPARLSQTVSSAQLNSSRRSESPNLGSYATVESAPDLRSAENSQRITANQPDFDLETLLKETAPESTDGMKNNLSDRSNPKVPSSIPDRQFDESSPNSSSPDISGPRVSLNPSASVLPTGTAQAPMGTPSLSASQKSQQPNLLEEPFGESSQASRNSVIREGQATSSQPTASQPTASSGVAPEEAIRRAAEAAISGGFSSRTTSSPTAGEPSIDPVTGLRMTQNPLPVLDWTRYLPPPPAGLTPSNLNSPGVSPSNREPNLGAPGFTPQNPYQAVPDFQPSTPAPGPYQMPLVPGGLINPPAGRQLDRQSSNFSAAGYGATTLQPPASANPFNGVSNPYATPETQPPGQQIPGGQSTGFGYPTIPPNLP